jgi:hypothetical protein
MNAATTHTFAVWNAADPNEVVTFQSDKKSFRFLASDIAHTHAWTSWECDLEENYPNPDSDQS